MNTSQKYPSTKTTRKSFYKIQKTYLHIAYSGFKLTKSKTQHHVLRVFLTVDRPLGTNFFLSPAFRCYKFKDGGHNFWKENTEHSIAKITPALQARY